MKYELTKQQTLIISTIKSELNGQIILVNAAAGCGKTSTSQAVVEALHPKKGLYTAFNKAIVMEGKEKFTENMDCRTLHSLALSFVRPKLNIEDFTYLCIKEKLSYPNKMKIIRAMDEFYRSSSSDMDEYLTELLSEDPKLIPITIKYIEQMVDDKVAPTFNFLLKYFHLLLHEGQIEVKYDLVILDEIQDSTGVALEIFKLLTSPKKLGLGDPHQGIYGFMNLVNGFEILKSTATLELTYSFRCSQEIASRVQDFGKKYLSKGFEFEGTETPIEDGLTAYITATNAFIILRINELHRQGKGYILTRPVKDIFACPLALVTAAAGKEVYHKRYKFLEKERKNFALSNHKSFFSYLKSEVKDDEIHAAIDLLMRFKQNGINIWDVLADAKKAKKDKSTTVGTFFSLKGLEYSTVYIENDLNTKVTEIIEDGGPADDGQLTYMKGAYVATTRARKHLKNCKFL